METYTYAVNNLHVHNSVFNIAEHNNVFRIFKPGYWQDPDKLEKLEKLTEQRKTTQIVVFVNEMNNG